MFSEGMAVPSAVWFSFLLEGPSFFILHLGRIFAALTLSSVSLNTSLSRKATQRALEAALPPPSSPSLLGMVD